MISMKVYVLSLEVQKVLSGFTHSVFSGGCNYPRTSQLSGGVEAALQEADGVLRMMIKKTY